MKLNNPVKTLLIIILFLSCHSHTIKDDDAYGPISVTIENEKNIRFIKRSDYINSKFTRKDALKIISKDCNGQYKITFEYSMNNTANRIIVNRASDKPHRYSVIMYQCVDHKKQ